MTKTEIHHPDKKVSTGAYSTGVVIDGWLFISGQGPIDFATGKVVAGTVEEETRVVLSHVGKILEAAGCDFDDVVKCTCHLSDVRDFDGFNRKNSEFFSGVRPARTTVQSVLWGGIKVEIDATARVPGK
jgi:2-iminobutanoate/2-iminopropanoate deaminase